MSLHVVQTPEEQLVSIPVREALAEAVRLRGAAVLLVPSFAQALDAQRVLAGLDGLALSVTTTTPAAWVRERWEVWGDGRSVAGGTELAVLAHEAVRSCPAELRGPIELSPGVAQVLTQLVDQVLPWLPLDEAGRVREEVCANAGLTRAETCLVGLAGRLGTLLAQRGMASAAEVSHLVPKRLGEEGVDVAPVVVAGFTRLSRAQRALLQDLAELTQVTVVGYADEGPAFALARETLQSLNAPVEHTKGGCAPVERDSELAALRQTLFGTTMRKPLADGPVELLLAAGPVAEAELVARRVEELAHSVGASGELVVAVPDVSRAQRELVPKLVTRGVPVRLGVRKALMDCPAAQAFFAFASAVAHLDELADTWPQPVAGVDGMMVQLGDMSWWPPRDLSDFLLADIAHVDVVRGWQEDARWRGNRLLTPMALLAALQAERETSSAVAHATQELLRGRIGSAASKLLLPYVERLMGAEVSGAEDDLSQSEPIVDSAASVPEDHTDEARAVLQAILSLAGTLHELGISADPSTSDAVPLSELVDICGWAAEGISVASRLAYEGAQGVAVVRLMNVSEAARLAPGSVDVLVACGLTTAEQGIGAGDDLLEVLLDELGVEPQVSPMAQARASFHALVGVPRRRLVLERALHDADAKEAYPSVMLSELLAAYGISAKVPPAAIPFAQPLRVETNLGENLGILGAWPELRVAAPPAASGRLTDAARSLVFVPQNGSDTLPGGKPVLSASQIETYLDCPYKWFSLRRLRLGQVDAGHTAMEMGTFAHRVLEVTHHELLLRALEAQMPGVAREELLALVEADPVRAVPGSRVDASTLEDARRLLDEEFELHRQHMFMVKRPRQAQQLLVAHDSADRAREERLRLDLLSSLDYQTRILTGFEPRFFEWGFGRHGDLVEYAGAYFTGTVDRIDVSPHGTAVIIDYKHKSPGGFNAEYDALQDGVLEGEQLPNRVQSLIYAQVVRRAFAGKLHLAGTVYLSTKGDHALAGAADENVADLVFGKVSSRRAPRVCVPRAQDGGSGMDALLDRTEELVAREVEQMLAGNVEARPRDARSCDFCPVMQCERRRAR